MNPIKIMLYFAAYGRADVLRITCMGIARLRKYQPSRYSIDAFCVYSGAELKPVLEEFGIRCMEHENLPVGTKKNAGLNEIMKAEYEWDYMLELGSDDLISNKLLDKYLLHMIDKEEMIGIKACHFLDVKTGEVAFWENTYTIGLARAIHRSALERIGGSVKVVFNEALAGADSSYIRKKVYTLSDSEAKSFIKSGVAESVGDDKGIFLWSDINYGLDYNSEVKLLRVGVKPLIVETGTEVVAVDLKDDLNIHPFAEFTALVIKGTDVLKGFSKAERDACRELRSGN